MKIFLYLTVCIIGTMPSRLLAAEYYIDPAHGLDTNPGTESLPWRTFKNAVSSLIQPGDTIFCRGGIYSEHAPDLYGATEAILPIFRYSGIDGEPDTPITFKAYKGEVPVIDPQNNSVGIMFQGASKTGIIIDGFEIRNAYHAGIWFQDNCSHITIRNCHIHSIYAGASGMNIGGFVFNGSNNITIIDTQIHNSPVGVYLFQATNHIRITNCEIYNTGLGIFHKHDGNGPNVFENNYLHDIERHAYFICSDNITMRNNLIVNTAGTAFRIHGEAGCTHCSRNNIIEHNTVINAPRGYDLMRGSDRPGAINTTIRNNIFHNIDANWIWHYGSNEDYNNNTPQLHANTNVYYPATNLQFSYFGNNSEAWGILGGVFTLEEFQSQGYEIHSRIADPLFMDIQNGDYGLQHKSPCIDGAGDGTDIGADVSIVGIRST